MLYGEMQSQVTLWSREAGEPDIVSTALNDAVEKLSDAILCCRLGDFMGGPVEISLTQGTERITVVSVQDPTVAPTVTSSPAPAGSIIAGGVARTVNVAITFVTPSGSETLASPLYTGVILANNLMNVVAPFVDNSANTVYGYCVYYQQTNPAAPAGNAWMRMNAQPVPIGQTFVEPLIADGGYPPQIPLPTQNLTGDTIFYIDHMEVLLPDGTYKAWNQGDIDGDYMRRMAGIISSASQYQNYAFDVVNGSQIEIRPSTSLALNPRYFYVKRPGRVQFPNVILPFANVSSTEPFLRYETLALLFMTLNEPDQAIMWQNKADVTLSTIRQTQTRTRARKELRVMPYRGMM